MTNYFSQYGQDKFLNEEIFKGKKNGFFVDIGAFDGISLSNTFFFEKELGWNGVCVEPASKAFAELSKNRTCAKENVCISNKSGKEEFLEIDGPDSMLSGLYAKYDSRHKRRILKEKTPEEIQISIQMNCLTPSDLFTKHKITEVDFCSIDTEGSEIEIIKNIDFSKVKIKYFTIENAYANKKLSKIMRKNGYTLIRKIEYDDVFMYTGKMGYLETAKLLAINFLKKLWLDLKSVRLREDFKIQKKLLAGRQVRTIIHSDPDLSLTAAKYLRMFPKTKVYSFEPTWSKLNDFKTYFTQNSLVVPEEFALSDKDSESMIRPEQGFRTKTIDTYALEQNRNRIDVLRLDTDNELDILKGAHSMLEKKAIDILSLKVSYENNGQRSFKNIENFLSKYGYSLLKIHNEIPTSNGEATSADVLFISPELKARKIAK